MINWKHFGQMVVLFIAYLAFVCALMWISITLSGCAYATGSGPVCGGKLAHLSVYTVLRQQGLALTCASGESLTVGASSELSQLATLLGAAMALAAKSQGIPLLAPSVGGPLTRQTPTTLESTLDRLDQRLQALEDKQ